MSKPTDIKTIDLDKLFRKGSGAHKIAESLLTGEPVSRQELSSRANLAVTSVNRVIGSLEREGAQIERTIGEDGRQAFFRVSAIGTPVHENPIPAFGAMVQIVRAEVFGASLSLDFVTDDCRYRGMIHHNLFGDTAMMGRIGEVVAISRGEHGDTSVEIEVDARRVLLRGTHIVV